MKKMKIAVIAALALALVVIVGQYALAQAEDAKDGGGRFMARIAQKLNLTPDQQTKAQAIFQQARTKALAVLTPAQQQTIQARRDKMGRRAEHGILKSLNLTADQKAKIKALRDDARTKAQAIRDNKALTDADRRTQLHDLFKATKDQIAAVLTPEQQAQVKQAMANHAGHHRGRAMFHGLNLTADQKTQLKAIRTDAETQFRALLTPDQQQQFDQMRAAHHRGR